MAPVNSRGVYHRQRSSDTHQQVEYAPHSVPKTPVSNPYPNLLKPLELPGVTLSNRVLMGSMHTGLEDRFWNYGKLAAYFAERADNGGPGLMVTGGISPNRAGWLAPLAGTMNWPTDVLHHRRVTSAVHRAGGRICMQILHAGRYGYHPFSVSASAVRAPISKFTPRALDENGVEREIKAYVRCAKLAQQAGYDGVEIMGSEGYFINQFLCPRTNKREDRWGGSIENRSRLALEIVRRVRAAVPSPFILIYRLSMVDLVEDGCSGSEVAWLGRSIEEAGATMINTGIGWHEARIPTIVTSVPHAAFAGVSRKFREGVTVPVITTNRINTPEQADWLLGEGYCDMVSMARPFLADPKFVQKTASAKAEEINTCIACNQACLDHIFNGKRATCLVNPRACHETELNYRPTTAPRRIAVVGAGPAGLSTATIAAERGHQVTLYEAANQIGGQFNIAKEIPGKEDFHDTLRYYDKMVHKHGVDIRLQTAATAEMIRSERFDDVVVATGVRPRPLSLPGIDHAMVLRYDEVVLQRKPVGQRVAIIGAGGIGFDLAEYLLHDHTGEDRSRDERVANWYREWGIDPEYESRGGIVEPVVAPAARVVTLLQRKPAPLGKGLGKTTGWVHRLQMRKKNVAMLGGVAYQKIDDQGLHILIEDKPEVLEVDNVIVCAGQLSVNELYQSLDPYGKNDHVHLIGGAYLAAEVDAKRAIREGALLAARL